MLDGRPVLRDDRRAARTSDPALGINVGADRGARGAVRADRPGDDRLRPGRDPSPSATWRGWSSSRASARAQYANLSWGVLSSLIRTLDERDKRAARHCAAVAQFSRDIAAHVGHGPPRPGARPHRRAAARHRPVRAVRPRHGARGPAHRGGLGGDPPPPGDRRRPAARRRRLRARSPRSCSATTSASTAAATRDGLKGDEIPEIARIVAVAEVYDTLTAPDTYRTQMNSFEALTELRRVAGTQLDAAYVEALARAARRPGDGVPPRRRRGLRRRAGHRAADERGRRA